VGQSQRALESNVDATANTIAALLTGAPYYGCFVRDPDGHKIEASFWDMAMEEI